MSTVEYHDTCQTAADVMAAAAHVRQWRRAAFFVPSKPAPVKAKAGPIETKAPLEIAHKPEVIPPIETTLAEKFIGPIEKIRAQDRLPRLDDIKVAVCNFYRVRAIDLLSARRTKNICLPRQVAMWLGRRTTLQSFPAIGRYFGGRDHSTAVHAVNKIDARLADHEEVEQHITHIADALRSKGFLVDLTA